MTSEREAVARLILMISNSLTKGYVIVQAASSGPSSSGHDRGVGFDPNAQDYIWVTPCSMERNNSSIWAIA